MSRYKAYPEYVPSEVEFLDSLPVGWRTLRGKYVFSEYSERSEYGEEPLLSVSEYYGVKPRGEVVEEGDFLSRAESLVGYKKCQKNDLVMNIMLAWKCGLGVSKYDGIVSPAYSVFRFNGNAVPDYMHYLLRTETYTGHFKTRSTGVIDSRLRLYPESFGDVSIILPPAGEQKKIIAFLEHETAKIDALIEKQQRLIELLKEKRQAVISHAVTKGLNPNAPMKDSGVEWLGEVPMHWNVMRIKQISLLISKGTTPSTIGEELADEGVRFLKAENIGKSVEVQQNPEFFISKEVNEKIARSKLEEGDVLVIIAGATTGLASILDKSFLPANTNQAVSFIRPARLEYSKLIAHWLSTEFCQRIIWMGAVQAAQPNLSMEDLGNIPIVIPPGNELCAIGKTIKLQATKFDHLIAKAASAIELMQERRTALISAAVTGKIDVRDWQAAA
jgi:type I restriction enzyme S subunit